MVRWTKTIQTVTCLLIVVALAGCDSVTGVCPAIAEPALSVTTLNAETDAPIDLVQVVVRDGSFADTAFTHVSPDGDPISASLGFERPGAYDVTAEKEGFSTWTRSGVIVDAGACGPETVELTARLAPLSG